jgi:GMP synthase-like glutamine amidotransferase
MRALIVQHEPDGPPGLLGAHLVDRGYDVDVLQIMQPGSTFSDVAFPDPRSYDLVAPMGAVAGVYDHDLIGSWVHREIEMLQVALDAGVPLFGICFGAQAITMALGGHVELSPSYEIGWYTYDLQHSHVAAGPWFTWHGDRCLLPPHATELARTADCTQLFRCGRAAGVQFHPEVTQEVVTGWVAKCPPEYFADRGTSAAELLAGFDRHGAQAAAQASTLFDWFLDDVAH